MKQAAPEQNVAETKPVEAPAIAPETGATPVGAAKAEGDDAKPERNASTDVKAAEPAKPVDAKTKSKVDAPKAAETPKAEAKPDTVKADITKPDDAKPAKKDDARITPPAKVVRKSPRRTSNNAVFISGKDSKLYVRQNFAPLFDVPVTIAAGDRPLGMHLFTAQVDKDDSNALHWSVVTVPMRSRVARGEDRRERVASAEAQGRATPAAGRGQADRSGQPDRGARPHHRSAGGDGAHRRGAEHGRLDHRGGPEHQAGRDRRIHRLHPVAALAPGNAGG